MSSTDSNRSRKLQPVIITHSRNSSAHSRSSDSSQSTTEANHGSSRSSSMTNGDRQTFRVPDKLDNNSHLINTKSYKGGKYPVKVIHQHAARNDVNEPRASKATYEDYKKTRQGKH